MTQLYAYTETDVRPVTRRRTTEERRGAPGVLWCPFCDRSLMDDRERCRCGAAIRAEAPEPEPQPAPESEPDWVANPTDWVTNPTEEPPPAESEPDESETEPPSRTSRRRS